MTVIKPNHSRLPSEHYYYPCQVITPFSEYKTCRNVPFFLSRPTATERQQLSLPLKWDVGIKGCNVVDFMLPPGKTRSNLGSEIRI